MFDFGAKPFPFEWANPKDGYTRHSFMDGYETYDAEQSKFVSPKEYARRRGGKAQLHGLLNCTIIAEDE